MYSRIRTYPVSHRVVPLPVPVYVTLRVASSKDLHVRPWDRGVLLLMAPLESWTCCLLGLNSVSDPIGSALPLEVSRVLSENEGGGRNSEARKRRASKLLKVE